MFPTRFTDESNEMNHHIATPTAFLLFGVAPANTGQTSSMQWLYQRMYEDALQASKPKPMASRELFAIMN
jgi:hypothetical protein